MRSIYLDMDGVVADWVTGCENIIGRRIEDPHEYCTNDEWIKIRDHGRMFKDLPKLPEADKIVSIARNFRDNLGWNLYFLTAIPHNNDMPWSFHDKVLWGQTHYPDIPVFFGPYSRDKQHRCSSGDILIDDRTDNCERWVAAGGIAVNVPVTNYTSALLELDRIYNEEAAKLKTTILVK